MDSANAGTDLDVEYPGGGRPDQAPVPLPAGTWRIRAVYAEADGHTWAGLVHLLPTSHKTASRGSGRQSSSAGDVRSTLLGEASDGKRVVSAWWWR